MNYSKEYKEHIEHTFAAFCKIVLRNAAFNAYRDIGRKLKHENSLEYLMEEKYFKPSTTDSYFEKQSKPTVYHVCGKTVIIENEQLGQAFSILSEQRKHVLILYFYCHYTDAKIGQTACALNPV